MLQESKSWFLWKAHRRLGQEPFRSQLAEVFFSRETGEPLFVMWRTPPQGSPTPQGETFHFRSFSEELKESVKTHRLGAIAFIKGVLHSMLDF